MFGGDTIQKIRIEIESFFDSKGFIEAETKLDAMSKSAEAMNLPFDVARKTIEGFNKAGYDIKDVNNQIKDFGKNTIGFYNKFGVGTNQAKTGISQYELYNKAMKKTDMTLMHTADNTWALADSVKGVGLSGKQAMGKLGRATTRFNMGLLSAMFFSMQLQRTFGGFLKTAIDGYMKLTNAQTPAGKAILRFQASWEYFKYSVIEALTPLIIYFSQMMTGITDWMSKNPELMKWIGIVIVAAAAVGVLGFWLSNTKMMITTFLIPALDTMGIHVAVLWGPISLIILALLLTVAACIVMKTAWDENWFGIRTTVEGVRRDLQPMFKDIGDWILDIKHKLEEMLKPLKPIQDAIIAFKKFVDELRGVKDANDAVVDSVNKTNEAVNNTISTQKAVGEATSNNTNIQAASNSNTDTQVSKINSVWNSLDKTANMYINRIIPSTNDAGDSTAWLNGKVAEENEFMKNIISPLTNYSDASYIAADGNYTLADSIYVVSDAAKNATNTLSNGMYNITNAAGVTGQWNVTGTPEEIANKISIIQGSRQFGGPISQEGAYWLHEGEYVQVQGRCRQGNNI